LDDLKTLVKLLSVQKVKQIEIITEDAEMSPMTRALYEGIKSGDFDSDEDAARKLYNSGPKHAAYRKLKYRLKQRMLNTLFFIDIQAYSKSEFQKAHAHALKNWAAYKILYDKGLRNEAISVAENVLKTSLRYDLTELSLSILKELKFHYGLFNSNKYKYDKYSNLFSDQKEIYDYESLIEDYYLELARILLNTKNYTYDNHIIAIEEKLVQINSDTRHLDSFNLKYYLYNALYFVMLIKSDIKEQLELSVSAINYFKTKKGFKNIALFSFTQKKGIALLSMKNYEGALLEFNQCLKMIPRKTIGNTHFLMNYIFLTYITKKDYSKAIVPLTNVIQDKNFKNLNETFREPWYLKEAFINFLIKTGRIDQNLAVKHNLRPFRLSRFLNEVSTVAKDKRGLNITINIIEMLFLIVEEKYDDVLDKLSALRQYNFRYLKRPEYSRSSNFVKMILKIPEGDYKASLIRKKAKKYYNKLLENPNDYSEHALSLEIIPYEQLWDEIMRMFPD